MDFIVLIIHESSPGYCNCTLFIVSVVGSQWESPFAIAFTIQRNNYYYYIYIYMYSERAIVISNKFSEKLLENKLYVQFRDQMETMKQTTV